jgi:cytoskeleton protein RodZ
MLRMARERLGLSQKEVADHLYLTTNFIAYIDEGSFEKIPKPAFIKGYVRSYAKVVELDGDELIAMYEEVLKAAEASVEFKDVTEETVGSVKLTGPVLQAGLIGLGAVAIVVGLVWWIASDGDDTDTPVVVTQQRPEPEETQYSLENERAGFDFIIQDEMGGDPEVRGADEIDGFDGNVDQAEEGIEETDSSENATEVDEDTEASIESDTESVTEAVIETAEVEDGLADESDAGDGLEETTSGAAEEVVEPDDEQSPGFLTREVSLVRNRTGNINYITLDAGGIDEIEVMFSNECWLEIEDGNGDTIYGDLNRVGDVLQVFGIAPFDLLFGRATEVSLSFNGHEIDIGRYTQPDETAKVRLANTP